MNVEFKRLQDGSGLNDLPLPSRESTGAAGYDIRSNETTVVPVGKTVVVSTGFAIAVPDGYEAQCRPRSGLAAKHSITIVNSPGTIDSDYRGEIKVILHNLGNSDFNIERGERIAQLVFNKVEILEVVEVQELSSTDRGTGGFGSTGKQ